MGYRFFYFNENKLVCEYNWWLLMQGKGGGVFSGDNSFLRILPFTMFRLTLFYILSETFQHLFKPLKQCEFVNKMLAGIILGPLVLGRFHAYKGVTLIPSLAQFMNVAAYLSLIYYLFLIAVKTDCGVILRFGKKVWIMGASILLGPFIIMSILLYNLKPINLEFPKNMYTFALQISSTWFVNLAPLLEEFNLLATELGQLSLSLALANEFLLWGINMIMIIVFPSKYGITVAILSLSLMIIIVAAIRSGMLWVIKKIPRGQPVKELYIVGTFILVGITAVISEALVGSPFMGVIFLGLILPNGPPLGLAIVERSQSFIKLVLLPFYFIAVGNTIIFNVKNHPEDKPLEYQLIIIIGYLTKTFITMFFAMWYNMKSRQAFALGLVVSTSGVAHINKYWGQFIRHRVNEHILSQMVLSSVFATAVLTPMALHFQKEKSNRVSDSLIGGFNLSLQSALISGKMHLIACVDCEEDIPGLITILRASNPTESHPINVYLIHLIELVGQAVPMMTPHTKHKQVCKYNGCVEIMNVLEIYNDTSEGGLKIQLLTMIAPFTSIYQSICKLAEDRMIPLIIVPFNYKSQTELGITTSSQINIKLQQETPCTVGIFVHRASSKKPLEKPFFSYHIVVIFCGGEDDREALSYAIRMSTHPGVSITMLRIFVQNYHYYNNNDENKWLDDVMIDKFKVKTINNACSIYKEFHVKEWIHTLKVIRSLDNIYDLVMVGRRHGEQDQPSLEHDLYVLSSNPELGEIGEFIVSPELYWENTSLLVMQHCLASYTNEDS